MEDTSLFCESLRIRMATPCPVGATDLDSRMHRRDLIQRLNNYTITERHDFETRDRFVTFVESNPQCFERSLTIGHVTGSAWIVNPTRDRFLLTFHSKLNLWLQLGGHADGNSDILEVALREAREESGLDNIRCLSTEIFDLDIHRIPEHNGVAEHYHYDVRFLFEADDSQALVISEESHDLRWLTSSEIRQVTQEESILRMLRKSSVR